MTAEPKVGKKALKKAQTTRSIVEYSALLQALYGCLCDASGFESFLAHLQRYFHCNAANLIGLNINPRLMTFGWSSGVSMPVEGFYSENNVITHDTIIDLALNFPIGEFHSANDVDPQAGLLNRLDASLKRWLNAENIIDVAAMLANNNGDSAVVLTLYRNSASGVFNRDELRQLNLLAPHIRQAVTLYRQVYCQSADNISLNAALDSTPQANIVLSPMLEVVHANTKAKQWIEQVNHLQMNSDRGILFSDKKVNTVFQTQAFKLLQRGTQGHTPSVAVFSIDHPFGLPIRATLTPIAASDDQHGYQALLMQLFDPNISQLPRATEIAIAFALTPAEGRICEHLIRGFSVKEISQKIDRRESTIRDTIKSIFIKTGYNRQVELVAVILRTLPCH